jgi:thiamine transport system permease protein
MPKAIKPILFWFFPLVFLSVFFFYPLTSILKLSLTRSDYSLWTPFINAIFSPTIQRVIWFTIWQAFLSTILTLLVGLPSAYLFARYQFRGKSILRALTGVAFVMPTLVVATGFNALLGPKGWINSGLMSLFNLDIPPIQVINTLSAILLAHVFYNVSIVLRLVGDFWTRLDPRLEQAARTLGASRWQTFWQITFPLLIPAIAAASLLIFIFDFTSFGVILVLGGPYFSTIEVEIYYQTISLFNLPLAAVLSILQLFCTLLLTVIYSKLMNGLSRPLTQRSQAVTQNPLHSWQSRVFAFFVLGFIMILTTTPLLALAARSITNLEAKNNPAGTYSTGFTLDFYRALTINQQQSQFYTAPSTAIGISIGYALITVFLALIIGIPSAWTLSHDKKSHFNRIIDPILMLPLGTSAVTLGLGFIISLNKPPLDLRASPILIPISHTLVAFPFVIRSLTPALQSIQPDLRFAASVLGASPWQIIKHIDLPLVMRAIIVAATFAFTISIGEFGATSMIARPEFPTIPIVIYRYLSRPGGLYYGQAMALSTILMITTFLGMLFIEKFRLGYRTEF